jgi:hypothetical protein
VPATPVNHQAAVGAQGKPSAGACATAIVVMMPIEPHGGHGHPHGTRDNRQKR